MTMPARQRALAVAAFGTAVATGYVASLDDAPEPRSEALTASAKAVAPGPTAHTSRGDWPTPSADGLRAWGDGFAGSAPDVMARDGGTMKAVVGSPRSAPRPTAAVPDAAAPEPPEPPPPWRLIGRVDDGGSSRALLATPQEVLVVGEQETLQSRWRVERIDAEAVELRVIATGQVLRLAWEAPR